MVVCSKPTNCSSAQTSFAMPVSITAVTRSGRNCKAPGKRFKTAHHLRSSFRRTKLKRRFLGRAIMHQWRPFGDFAQHTVQRIHRIQTITIAWMTVEAAISLISAWKAQSPALLAFGGDSAIELLSATAVLWRFRVHTEPEIAISRIHLISLKALQATFQEYCRKPIRIGLSCVPSATLKSPQPRGIPGTEKA